MRELTIEEKAKRYDEALTKARNIVNSINVGLIGKDSFAAVFPEIKDSEDERIRKHLLYHFKNKTKKEWNGMPIKDILSWLENQGEQKPTEWNEEDEKTIHLACEFIRHHSSSIDSIGGIDCSILIERLKSLKGKVQPKQEWSEDDNIMARDIDCALRCQIVYPISRLQSMSTWINNLKGRVQSKQEWSKEDENIRLRLIDYLYGKSRLAKDREDGISWLESLKYRVQPQYITITDEELAQAKKDAYNDTLNKIEYHNGEPTFDDGWSASIWYLKKRNAQPQVTWKPSDEQMDILKIAVSTSNSIVLNSLYNDLKKLREDKL